MKLELFVIFIKTKKSLIELTFAAFAVDRKTAMKLSLAS